MSSTVKGISTAKGFHKKVPFAEHADKATFDNAGNEIHKTYRKIGKSLVNFAFGYRETMIFNQATGYGRKPVTLYTGEDKPFLAGIGMEVQVSDADGNWFDGYIRLSAVNCSTTSDGEAVTSLAGILTVLSTRTLSKFYHVYGVYGNSSLDGENALGISYVYDENGEVALDIYVTNAVVQLS